ncbi:MAG: amino acid permease [Actinobacteria bacterium]|uniref:Unannotated protein n=1 Tax=freshwater metagenome TaxID=449393 RepID=A0A6J7JLU7_9ZZZZ|nr:amino acid permease [Actinomycetota bacterium]
MSDPIATDAEPDGIPVTDVRSLRHGFSLWGASTLSFAAMRPLVGVAVGGYLITWAGLAGWTAVVLLLAVVLVVSLVFGALASRWPLEGSVAAWTRQLLGARTGMMAGWLYLCSYVLYVGTLGFFDSQRIFYVFAVTTPGPMQSAIVTAVVIAVATVCNSLSRRLLIMIVAVAVAASALGCLVLGTMLFAHAQRGILDLFEKPDGGSLDWAWWSGPFIIAVAWSTIYCLRGFELPADVAEEVREPRINVGRAMVWTVVVGGLLTLYGVIAVALAVPGASTVSGEVSQNPYAASVGTVIETALGTTAATIFAVLMIVVTFAALAIAQLAASRTLWTMARDRELPAHGWLVRLSSGPRMPVNALIVVGLAAAALPFVLPERTAYVLGGASAVPLLLAMLLPIVGLVRARRRGEWQAEHWGAGRWLGATAVVSAVALAALALTVAWPHEEIYVAGIAAWRPVIILIAIIVGGLILMAWAFRDGGVHVRNHGHVDRDLHERILLAHTGTCSVCHRALAEGEEVFWNTEAHVTICVTCDDDLVV